MSTFLPPSIPPSLTPSFLRLVEEMNCSLQPQSPSLNRRDSVDAPRTHRALLRVPGPAPGMDLTPASSPIVRQRMVSVGSPMPVVKLLADSLLSKVSSLKELLKDKLLVSILEDADPFMTPTGKRM